MDKRHKAVFIGLALGFLFLIALFFYMGVKKDAIIVVCAFFAVIIIAISTLLGTKK